MKALLTPSGAVIRMMIELGMERHDITCSWEGIGRENAMRQEAARIASLRGQDCILANVSGNSKPSSVGQVLQYLGVKIPQRTVQQVAPVEPRKKRAVD